MNKPQIGVINVAMRDIKNLPMLMMGERDILKVIQLLPGAQQAQEGTTRFLVRGGNTDQNLVQLDEATVYNPNHLFGLVSTFNINSINNVQLIKGGSHLNMEPIEFDLRHHQFEKDAYGFFGSRVRSSPVKFVFS